MNEISKEIQKEIQIIIDLLQIKYLEFGCNITKYGEEQNVNISIEYKNASGEATISSFADRRNIINHGISSDFQQKFTKIDLGSEQEYFESTITRLLTIVKRYAYTREFQDLCSSFRDASNFGFSIKRIRYDSDLDEDLFHILEINHFNLDYKFTLTNNKETDAVFIEHLGDDKDFYKMTEAYQHFNNAKEIIESMEKIRDYLLPILFRVNFVS